MTTIKEIKRIVAKRHKVNPQVIPSKKKKYAVLNSEFYELVQKLNEANDENLHKPLR